MAMRKKQRKPAAPWDQQLHEPNVWYQRFCAFRDQGPERTLIGAYRIIRGKTASVAASKNSTVPTSWQRQRLRWEWLERAQAWDEEQFAAAEQKVRKRLEQHYIDALDLAHQSNAAALKKALEVLGLPAIYKEQEDQLANGDKRVRAALVPIAQYRGAQAMAEEAVKFIERLTGRRTDPDAMDGLTATPAVQAAEAPEVPLAMRDMEWLRELPAVPAGEPPAGKSGNGDGNNAEPGGNGAGKHDHPNA